MLDSTQWLHEMMILNTNCEHLTLTILKLIAARQGGCIVPYVWEIVAGKNLTIFEGCHFPRFYIMDLIEFCENQDKKF